MVFLCGHFKDDATGKVESDIWPVVLHDGKWWLVAANKEFVANDGPRLMEYFTSHDPAAW
jgi:hypothetical protein